MFQSKALKDDEYKRPSKFYLWWIESAVGTFYYRWQWRLWGRPIQDIKKVWGWYRNVFYKGDYDFDGYSLFTIIEYKLKRVEQALLHGHAIQEKEEMHAIKLAIKLAGRLRNDKYDERGWDRVDKRFGESKHWFEPCNDGTDNSYMRSSRPKVNTPEDEEQERQFRILQYELSEKRRDREERWFYAILKKYIRRWWD